MTTPGETEIIDPDAPDPGLGPDVLPRGPNYPEINVTALTPPHQLLDDELHRMKYALQRIDEILPRITHPDELCRVILTQQKLLEARRKHLSLPFGFGQRGSKADDFYDN